MITVQFHNNPNRRISERNGLIELVEPCLNGGDQIFCVTFVFKQIRVRETLLDEVLFGELRQHPFSVSRDQ